VNDDLQARLAAADPLADAHRRMTPAASRLDAIKERIMSEDTMRVGARRLWRPAALGLLATLVVAGAVVAAGALWPKSFQAAGSAVAGQQYLAKGSGCAADAAVTVTLDGKPFGTAVAGANGEFAVMATVADGTSLGNHEMTSTCANASGQNVVQTVTIEVVAASALWPKDFQGAGSAVAGQTYLAKGSGCAAGAAVTVTLDGKPFGTASAGNNGEFAVMATVADGTLLGNHEMTSTCAGADGQNVVQAVTIEVVPPVGPLPSKPLP
jgi:hypothetical protein